MGKDIKRRGRQKRRGFKPPAGAKTTTERQESKMRDAAAAGDTHVGLLKLKRKKKGK